MILNIYMGLTRIVKVLRTPKACTSAEGKSVCVGWGEGGVWELGFPLS